MSAIEFQSGCAFGSQKITCGSISNGATTPSSGCARDCWTSSSEFSIPIVIDGSAAICAETGWLPIAGPPARISSRTPVSTPDATSGPVTDFLLASIREPAPSSWYSAACSTCGNHDDWTLMTAGQTPLRLS